ncbi:glutathione S-transferase family protein [Pelagibius litoralis]|uniref:Glutathione S-transferase family protein n=1 Tax=Pelagibius litoralis TaxID=374515 RepID=A0A967F2V1_9PROT|nr:glutathione S-transferase family protein [Pelagibius litoralis]NIA71890.1 glutathione S-transferase family protein [Pelagibius litoralis]
MYKLYWAPDTGAFAPEVVLALAGAPVEKVLVDHHAKEQKGEAYRKLNPMGQIPLLILPDGQVMTESAAMVLYLVDCFPEAGLAPPPGSPERAAFDRWLVFMAVNIYTADLRLYYAERYSTDPVEIPGIKAAATRDLDRQFAIVSAALGSGPFLQGARYSAADLYLLMVSDWYPPAQELPAIARLRQALLEDSTIHSVWAIYRKD